MQQRQGFSAVLAIVIANIIVFLLQQTVDGLTQTLWLDTSAALLHPWTLLTSMFLHANVTHLVFNMYALFVFGPLIEQRTGTKRFLIMYFASGIAASLGYTLFQELIIGQSAAALGASGAVMGVLGVTIIMLPDLKVLFFFIIPMSMRTAGIIFALIDIFGIIPGVAHVAHLVGLGAGLLFGKHYLKQRRQFHVRFSQPKRKRGKKTGQQHLDDDAIEDYFKHGRL